MPVPTPRIPPADWRQELAERERAAAQARARHAAIDEEVPARRPPPVRQTVEVGAPPPSAWRIEQLRADLNPGGQP